MIGEFSYCTYCQEYVSFPHTCPQYIRGTAEARNISAYKQSAILGTKGTQITFDGGKYTARRKTYYRS